MSIILKDSLIHESTPNSNMIFSIEEAELKREILLGENHSRIDKLTHKCNNKSKWEEILKNITIKHLKFEKRLDY